MYRLIIFLLLASCAHKQVRPTLDTPKTLYKQAKQDFSEEKYKQALENIKKLQTKSSYSSWRKQAHLLEADIYFERQDFEQAKNSYLKFLKHYGKKDSVLYKLGLIYLKELPSTPDRDISSGKEAKKYFQSLLKNSRSRYKKQAQEHLKYLTALEIQKELKISLFYKGQGKQKQAMKRLQSIIKKYPRHSETSKTLLLAWEISQNKNYKKTLLRNFPKSKESQNFKNKL